MALNSPWFLTLFLINFIIVSGTMQDILVKLIIDSAPVLFPPSRVSLHLCSDVEDIIELSRELSRNNLMHNIRNGLDDLDPPLYDNLEHRNLYVLDLDCDYSLDLLKTANVTGMFIAPARWLIIQDSRIDSVYEEESILENSTDVHVVDSVSMDSYPKSDEDFIINVFKDLAVFPDSDVVLAVRLQDDFLQLTSIYRPSSYRGVILEDRGNWTNAEGLRMRTFDPASRRRMNLHMTPLKSCLVMTEPDTINHLTDYQDKQIDPVTKANYPWMLYFAARTNSTISFNVTNTWGYSDENGHWSGMIGMLQRREIDMGGTATFLIKERIGVVKYIQLYTHTSSQWVFRQPLLSSVSNIFILPFNRSVWLAIAVFLVLVLLLLYVSMRWEHYRGASIKTADYWEHMNPGKPSVSDDFMVVLGALSQQGFSYEPYKVPSRIVVLMLLFASLSLYAAYTANIVALLQSTTNSIKTVADLYYSPLKLGVQDVIYNRHYFKLFQDPLGKKILQKIEPKNQKTGWMDIEEGVSRLKEELFAFHGEIGIVYKIMQETFQEEEKCGLTEIDYLNVLFPLVVIQTQSPYLEIVKNWALLLRETGLKYRDEYRLYTKKPVCHGHISFISIGITECYFAMVTMSYGCLITCVIFLLELLWNKRQRNRRMESANMASVVD